VVVAAGFAVVAAGFVVVAAGFVVVAAGFVVVAVHVSQQTCLSLKDLETSGSRSASQEKPYLVMKASAALQFFTACFALLK